MQANSLNIPHFLSRLHESLVLAQATPGAGSPQRIGVYSIQYCLEVKGTHHVAEGLTKPFSLRANFTFLYHFHQKA